MEDGTAIEVSNAHVDLYRPDMRIVGGQGLLPEPLEDSEILVTQTQSADVYQGKNYVLEDQGALVLSSGFTYEAAASDSDGLTVRMRTYSEDDKLLWLKYKRSVYLSL